MDSIMYLVISFVVLIIFLFAMLENKLSEIKNSLQSDQ
jgi:hypothetical protein